MSASVFDGVQHFENDENASPNIGVSKSQKKSPKSFKKLLAPEDDSLLPTNAISYLQKVRQAHVKTNGVHT